MPQRSRRKNRPLVCTLNEVSRATTSHYVAPADQVFFTPLDSRPTTTKVKGGWLMAVGGNGMPKEHTGYNCLLAAAIKNDTHNSCLAYNGLNLVYMHLFNMCNVLCIFCISLWHQTLSLSLLPRRCRRHRPLINLNLLSFFQRQELHSRKMWSNTEEQRIEKLKALQLQQQHMERLERASIGR